MPIILSIFPVSSHLILATAPQMGTITVSLWYEETELRRVSISCFKSDNYWVPTWVHIPDWPQGLGSLQSPRTAYPDGMRTKKGRRCGAVLQFVGIMFPTEAL